MTRVYGQSDDIVEVEGAPYPADEIGCYKKDVQIRFSDNTLIKVHYGKDDLGIWSIEVLNKGVAEQTLTECHDEDAEIYSDIFEIDADYVSHETRRAV